ncbi:unnamed protein product [Caenorhabditis auriculariae]|uniref:Uncharacterized protein n=1 Tax=Caenorhabditis auriculariae TaxID=2777116 RepID=A0A8S1H4T7_9PELO|nr:unnamed protein product [Caenorhabditis auriculariae]
MGIPMWLMKIRFLKWRYSLCATTLNFTERHSTVPLRREASLRASLTEEGNDFVEAYLWRMKKDQKDGVEGSFDLFGLKVDLLDLWLAGQETTSTTLMWAVILLLNNPEVGLVVDAFGMALGVADTVIDGQPVCAGVMINAKISLIMADENNFKEPEKFNPSHCGVHENLSY